MRNYIIRISVVFLILAFCFSLLACSLDTVDTDVGEKVSSVAEGVISDIGELTELPEFDGSTPYVVVNNNNPFFEDSQITDRSYEFYSSLDDLGRCGMAEACIGTDLMPTEERGEIGQVKPSGWQIAKYDFVDGKYLYNRCHLIGYQLSGENANKENLITGTRYLNVQGMLPFENQVADYVRETGNHVMYRVTPLFSGSNLLADGVLMEALSVEDNGLGVKFNVFCYNNQPGVEIDYATGNNHELPDWSEHDPDEVRDFVININSGKFHRSDCSGALSIKKKNRQEYRGTRQELIDSGYSPCQICNP